MYGPADGIEGLKKNVALMEKSRVRSVGPDFRLMFDCYMSLTVPYTIDLAKALEPYDVYWLEECLPPDDYDGCAELKSSRIVLLVHRRRTRIHALRSIAN